MSFLKSVISLLLIFQVSLTYGQEARSIIKIGDTFFNNEDYFRATNYYLKALEREPKNVVAKYRLAESYRLITNYQDAERFYGEVLRRSESLFPLARYYYALTQKFNGRYEEALSNFQTFLKNIEAKRYNRLQGNMVITFSEQARIELEGCLLALEAIKKSNLNHNFHLLQQPVNSIYNDYAAYPYHHDSTIVLTSARLESKGSHFDNRFGESLTDLFRFQFEDGEWTELSSPDRFGKEMNSNYHDGSGIFNMDYSGFYFTHCGSDTGCKIYYSRLTEGKWSSPTPLNTNINKPKSDSMHPALTASGDTLFFASDRAGGLGEFDIWMSTKTRGNNWGPAHNLGDYINTAFREISPFYDVLGNTLFFSSDGHLGHGGLDIIMAEEIFNSSSEVFNMGIPYNSSSDDAFFVLGESGGFLSSNRQNGIGNFDIYAFQIDSDSEIITEIINSNQLASRNSIFVTDYTFDNPDIKLIEAVVSNLMASRLHNTKLPFSQELQVFYASLSEADKIRVERIINSRMKSTGFADLQTIRHEDEFFYQQIAGDFRYYVDRMVTYYMEDYDLGAIVKIPKEDKAFYENLNNNSKSSIDRFIALKINEYEKLDLNDEYYLAQPANTKRTIDNLSETYFKAKVNLSSLDLTNEDMDFLSGLDETERERTELSIANQVAVLSSREEYRLNDTDRSFYENLTDLEKSSLDQMAQAYIESSVNNLEDHLDTEGLDYYNNLKPKQREVFDKLLAKRIQNFIKADKYTLEALPSTEIDQVIYLSLNQTDLTAIEPDSALIDNSLIKEMAKEDLKRFSRLLSSAASLIMMNSPSPLKAAALKTEKRQDIFKIIKELDKDAIPVLTTEQTEFYQGLSPQMKTLVDGIVADKLLEIMIETRQDSLKETDELQITEQKMSSFSPGQLVDANPKNTSIRTLNEDDQKMLSRLLVDLTNHSLQVHHQSLKDIYNDKSLATETLLRLKSGHEDPNVSQSDPNLDQIASVNNGEISNSESDLIAKTTITPIERADSNPSRIAPEVTRMVGTSKRQLQKALSEEQFSLYTNLSPMDKRFFDEALNKQLSHYVQAKNKVLLLDNPSSTFVDSLVTPDFKVAKFNSDPGLRRFISSVLKKPAEERKDLEALMTSTATFIITNNLSALKELANVEKPVALADNDSQNELKTDASGPAVRQEDNPYLELVTQTKATYLKTFTAKEMKTYMSLSSQQKSWIDGSISNNLKNYSSEPEIFAYNTQVETSEQSLAESRIKEDIIVPATTPFHDLNSEEKTQISDLIFKMTTLTMRKNAQQLRSLGEVNLSSNETVDNAADSNNSEVVETSVTARLSPKEIEVFDQLSPDEKALFLKLMSDNEPKTPSSTEVPSDGETGQEVPVDDPGLEKLPNINRGQWDGQVLTITVIEASKLDSKEVNPRQISIKKADEFKSGETVKLIWSQQTQSWYEIIEDQPK